MEWDVMWRQHLALCVEITADGLLNWEGKSQHLTDHGSWVTSEHLNIHVLLICVQQPVQGADSSSGFKMFAQGWFSCGWLLGVSVAFHIYHIQTKNTLIIHIYFWFCCLVTLAGIKTHFLFFFCHLTYFLWSSVYLQRPLLASVVRILLTHLFWMSRSVCSFFDRQRVFSLFSGYLIDSRL